MQRMYDVSNSFKITFFVQKTDKHLPVMASMFGIDLEQIRTWLCNRKVSTATEVITKPLTVSEAYFARSVCQLVLHKSLAVYKPYLHILKTWKSKFISVVRSLVISWSICCVFDRDALAKHVYSMVFQWIVVQLNKSLTSSIKTSRFIGILDIYG